jgi:mannose-1-phosphate guanylyltransferase
LPSGQSIEESAMTSMQSWGIVLAGGDGTRLRALTTDGSGHSVPKQFCSLRGGRSLLGDALDRARRVVAAARVLAVVAADHRGYWEPELARLPRENVLVQPRNRGTGAGLLLPLVEVAARDPLAVVAILPSDHHVEDEGVFCAALRHALRRVHSSAAGVILLGIRPDSPETEYGWILPSASRSRLMEVVAFVEKPSLAIAERLMDRGGLWNSFAIVARAASLLELHRSVAPDLVTSFRAARTLGRAFEPGALAELYEGIETSDFSRDVLEGSEHRLLVLPVPACGWTDLGTPGRVAQCLRRARLAAGAAVTSGRGPVLGERIAAFAAPAKR